jgi:hypothetical protein
VYLVRIVPLSEAPSTPPPGLHLEWAGLSLRGYGETVYISAPSCSQPAHVVMNLYPSVAEGAARPVRTPGRVAFAVTGDTRLEAGRIRVWEEAENENVLRRVLANAPDLPPAHHFKAVETDEGLSRRRSALAIAFNWAPVAYPSLTVAFDAYWVANRLGGESCWITIPALVGGGSADYAANAAIGEAELSRGYLGLPIYNAAVLVNGQHRLRVDPSNSIPTPTGLDPGTWNCGPPEFADRNCQAAAVLSPAGAESERTRALTLWSLGGGLLLAILATSMIAAARAIVVRGGHEDP